MNESFFEKIQEDAKYLDVDFSVQEIATLATEKNFSDEQLTAIYESFRYLQQKKENIIISTLLRTSRLPLKNPKTFEDYDFGRLRGEYVDVLKNISSLSLLYARKNLAFIGPPGVGKTHLAMAFGRACCERGMKAYFIKATELNQRLTKARKYGHEESTVNGLVRPTCLIIDEIGHCVFDKENTRLLFDVLDRRYNKDCPNTVIFTSNTMPNEWGQFFNEKSSLLCGLDRVFDEATVFMIKGESYRGQHLETYTIEVGIEPYNN